GEREMANDNRTLGRFHLVGIPPAPRGVPQIEVTFDIDANGILNVSARDKATGKEQKVRIEATGGLSEAEIKRMVTDAESHSEEDKNRREAIEAKNRGEQLAYETEKNLREMGDKIDSESKAKLDSAVERLKGAVQREDTEEIRAASEALQQLWNEVSTKLYQEAQAQGAGPQGGEPQTPGEEPQAAPGEGKKKGGDGEIDADYEVVK
ncbi:MAG TPA: Hsp70 family protein, partial [Candidatus Polarisedimenticolia bacterium]|nr:Hsp70 family protein [Candidatus Polarisedimenticolia bacterium]